MSIGIIDSESTIKQLLLFMVDKRVGQAVIPFPIPGGGAFFHVVLLRDPQESAAFKILADEAVERSMGSVAKRTDN